MFPKTQWDKFQHLHLPSGLQPSSSMVQHHLPCAFWHINNTCHACASRKSSCCMDQVLKGLENFLSWKFVLLNCYPLQWDHLWWYASFWVRFLPMYPLVQSFSDILTLLIIWHNNTIYWYTTSLYSMLAWSIKAIFLKVTEETHIFDPVLLFAIKKLSSARPRTDQDWLWRMGSVKAAV